MQGKRPAPRTALFFACLLAAAVCAALPFSSFLPMVDGGLLQGALVRALAAAALFAAFPFPARRLPPAPRPSALTWVALSLCFLVAANNFPLVGALAGQGALAAPAHTVILFALSCLATAAFEELLFRGLLLSSLMRRFAAHRTGALWAVAASSLAFGAFHLANLFSGQDIGPTLLQVGYATLIGAACACLVLFFGRLTPALLLHALYNFGGRLYHTLGTPPPVTEQTVIFTACLALVAAAVSAAALASYMKKVK